MNLIFENKLQEKDKDFIADFLSPLLGYSIGENDIQDVKPFMFCEVIDSNSTQFDSFTETGHDVVYYGQMSFHDNNDGYEVTFALGGNDMDFNKDTERPPNDVYVFNSIDTSSDGLNVKFFGYKIVLVQNRAKRFVATYAPNPTS